MRAWGIAVGAAATALLAAVLLRSRTPRAPEPEAESDIPIEAVAPPPLLERMPSLAARPRPPRDFAAEAEAIAGDAPDPAGAPGDLAPALEVVMPAAPAVEAPRPAVAPDAIWPQHHPDLDPPWPLFTEDEAGRRHAMRRGLRALARLGRLKTDGAAWAADRIRRDLTEGVFLPEFADPGARARLEARIADLNALVYTWPRALSGVTEIVVPARGDYPYRIVAERPFGSNTVLFWNRRGSLDPRRMPAGVPLVVPLEGMTLLVDRETRALHLLLGDAWIREFRIGVGADRTPTPAGRYLLGTLVDLSWVRRRSEDRFASFGTAWIGTYVVEFFHGKPRLGDRGPSIHGTDRPESIGLAESDGSIRLANRDATELLRWLDTHHGGPIRVYVR